MLHESLNEWLCALPPPPPPFFPFSPSLSLSLSVSSAFSNIDRNDVLLLHGWCHVKLLLSRRKFCVHCTTMHQFIVLLHSKPRRSGACAFICNLPPARLAEWPGHFPCYYGNTQVKRILKINESAHNNWPRRRKFSLCLCLSLSLSLSPPPYLFRFSPQR